MRASCADHVPVSYIIPLSSPCCAFVRAVSHAYERAARGNMCNGVVPPGILAITFEVGVTLPGHAAEAEVPWTRWAREHRRCGGGGKARGAEASVCGKSCNAPVREPTAADPLAQRESRGSSTMRAHRRSMLFASRFLTHGCCRKCSGRAVSQRAAFFGVQARGRAKVNIFIEKKGFSGVRLKK